MEINTVPSGSGTVFPGFVGSGSAGSLHPFVMIVADINKQKKKNLL
jgi:hypothetical protein